MVDQIENAPGRERAGMLVDMLPEPSVFRGVGARATLYPAVKRLVDIVGAGLGLLFFLPILLLVAWLIRQDGGPALFRHTRIGRNGRPFMCLKLRTMVVDAQKRLDTLLENDPAARAEWQRNQKLVNDPRVTRLGHLLRISSLDELPQLINVLRGEMSLVGPRPVTHAELERYGSSVGDYLSCKPGVTGLWQISGRSGTDYRQRVALDSEYARTACLRLDMAILVKTVRVILSRDGAC